MKRVILGIFVLISLALGGFVKWSSQPATGTGRVIVKDEADVKGTSVLLEDLSTRFFQTKTTSNLKFKTKSEAERAPIIGQYLLIDEDRYKNDQLAITIGTVKNQTVLDISPVQFRKTLPQEYVEVGVDQGYPGGSVVFTKMSGYEKSVFWVSGDKYVAIVVSGGTDRAVELNQSLQSAVQNFVWK